MAVYIYMFGSLSPVIDFAELEINYQTSIFSSFIIISLLDYYILIHRTLLETLALLFKVFGFVLMELNNVLRI